MRAVVSARILAVGGKMKRLRNAMLAIYVVALPVLGVAWVLRLSETLGLPLVTQQVIALVLGLAGGAAFLSHPYKPLRERSALLDVLLALAVSLSWFWYAWNFEDWMLLLAYRTPDMWVPGLVALILILEALRKSVGLVLAMLVAVIVAYGFFGDLIPGPLRAETFSPTKTILYLYADNSGIPGVVVSIIVNLVLPFVIFGKVMELAGGMEFFNNLALGIMGHRRGGPAKVAVVASSSFGTLSGSTVANIMSTGIITIPLMKRTGFRSEQASAIEAVASNGGQLMPPVMGATAFIIAEFLQVPYREVVIAGIAPALLYYLVLFLKIDAIAMYEGLAGLDKSEIPPVRKTLKSGWPFIFPFGVLVWLLFWRGYDPGLAAVYATGVLLALWFVKMRFRPSLDVLWYLVHGAGMGLVPLILIGGGAGAIVGIMNSTGFAFQLSLMLSHVAEVWGLFAMLLLTALVAIILGMGMPTSAVYIILVTVIAPTVIAMGVEPMGAHLFLLYFGLMSMITPPIAIGSIVAAQIAGANIWKTGFYGVRLGIAAYLLPFLWIWNPAVILDGPLLNIAIVLSNCVAAAFLLRKTMIPGSFPILPRWAEAVSFTVVALAVGSASIWLGVDNPVAFLPSLFGAVVALAPTPKPKSNSVAGA
jgi:TRAP transporter 4TM/12TM fusion protein